MRSLPAIAVSENVRTRRWDALILGGALPGLVSAVLLGKRGARVLVVEEGEAASAFPGLREPFFMTGCEAEGVLGACLRALGIPLIDRRRIESKPLAYQIVFPDARVDVGEPPLTADELACWGLAKAEPARNLVRALGESTATERECMLGAPIVRAVRRLPLAQRRPAPLARSTTSELRGALPAQESRGLPHEVSSAAPRLRSFFDAQLRALANLGNAVPSPEAQARLLGMALDGGASFSNGESLRGLLRRRIESLYGDFRRITGPFRMVSAANQPGILLEDSGEVWVGRTLILNAARQALAAATAQDPAPGLLNATPAAHRRVTLHFRVSRDVLPEGMSDRVICVPPEAQPSGEATEKACVGVVTFRSYPGTRASDPVDIVGSSVVPAGADDAAVGLAIEARLVSLMPFCEGGMSRVATPPLRWDNDDLLPDPEPGTGWPQEVDVRLSSRPLVYALDRSAVGALGFEGDLLLGWRAGDLIAAELS